VLAIDGFVAAYAIWYGLLRTYRLGQVAPFALLMPIIGVATAFTAPSRSQQHESPAGSV
jgi:O-acetylserine/cysteine efflux transporter